MRPKTSAFKVLSSIFLLLYAFQYEPLLSKYSFDLYTTAACTFNEKVNEFGRHLL